MGKNWGKPAVGLEDFIRALQPRDVYWLTTHCMDGDPTNAQNMLKLHLPNDLHEFIDCIKPTSWKVDKTEAIDFDSDFIWFDDTIFPGERKDLEKCREGQFVVEMDLKANPRQLVEIPRNLLQNL